MKTLELAKKAVQRLEKASTKKDKMLDELKKKRSWYSEKLNKAEKEESPWGLVTKWQDARDKIEEKIEELELAKKAVARLSEVAVTQNPSELEYSQYQDSLRKAIAADYSWKKVGPIEVVFNEGHSARFKETLGDLKRARQLAVALGGKLVKKWDGFYYIVKGQTSFIKEFSENPE